ncbi:YciI family protein [Microbacterium sp. 2FI]|uniref:YciI family protein n=1 Tax=Microbacterium sp. 2FI TaxID=2502193 RepID=UPI0010FA3BA8|nr:YciI family protein [Microbacterium sp. 2FI]
MQYLILIHNNPSVADMFAKMTDEERTAAYQVYWDVESDLEASGELVDSKALDDRTQQIVQRGSGGPVVTEAPLPETTEVVSGYYLVDVAAVERAHEIAARFPEAAASGGIRVARTLTQEDFDAMGS